MKNLKTLSIFTLLAFAITVSAHAQSAFSCYTNYNLQFTTPKLSIDTCATQITVSVSYTGNPSYIIWNDGYIGKTRVIDFSGNFQVAAVDSVFGCADTTPVMNVQLSDKFLSVSAFPYPGRNITLCKGQSLNLFATSNAPFQWNTGETATSISVNKSGKYFAKTTSGKCRITSDTIYLNIISLDNLKIKAMGDTAFCLGDSVKLEASGGYNYNWTTGTRNKNTIYAKTSGEYYVTVNDSLYGCYFRSNSIYINTTTPTIQTLCIVVADSATGKNKLKWTPANPGATAAYYVYRETSTFGTFNKIATITNPFQSEYIDSASIPKQRPYTYYVSILDTCGNESAENRWYTHTTMHLTASLGVNGENNLNWTDYMGIYPISTYVIYRSNKNGPFTEIGSVAVTTRSYSDLTPPSGNNRYAIGFRPDVACHSGSGSFSPGISNMVSFGILNTATNKAEEPILFPNPSLGLVQIQNLKGSNPKFTLYNIGGKILLEGRIDGGSLDISHLASGQYLLSVEGYKNTIVSKI